MRGDVADRPYEVPVSQYPDPTTFTTWQFYTLHGADVVTDCTSTITFSVPLPPVWLTLVPLALVVGTGYLLVREFGAANVRQAFLAGPGVTLGYFPMALVTLQFDQWTAKGIETPRYAAFVDGALLMTGFLYPVFLGGLGGILAFLFYQGGGSGPET